LGYLLGFCQSSLTVYLCRSLILEGRYRRE
jgi:hypothetical protein